MDFRQIFRTSKKDERITELEAQVARLTDQNTKIAEANQETERILADQDVFIAALKADKMRLEQEAGECFETITDLRARLDMAHAVETNQADVIATQKQGIVDLEAALVTSFGHIDELKQDVAALVERITELEHDAAKHDVASNRYVQQIKDLHRDNMRAINDNRMLTQENSELQSTIEGLQSGYERLSSSLEEAVTVNGEIGLENDTLLAFVRKCATGANIRADKPGGAKLVTDARALLKQYDSREVKAQ